MAISGARIPVSNTYARALAPSINLPSATLTGMPEPVGLLQGSIPQIVPTQGMLNYTPPVIDESGWNLPSSSFDVTQYVKDYWANKNTDTDTDTDTDDKDWKPPKDMSETYRFGHYWRMANNWLAHNPGESPSKAPWVWDGSKWVTKYKTTSADYPGTKQRSYKKRHTRYGEEIK